jgi:hypothetical protein
MYRCAAIPPRPMTATGLCTAPTLCHMAHICAQTALSSIQPRPCLKVISAPFPAFVSCDLSRLLASLLYHFRCAFKGSVHGLCRRACDCALSWQKDFNASLCIEQKFTCMCSTLPTQNAVAKIPLARSAVLSGRYLLLCQSPPSWSAAAPSSGFPSFRNAVCCMCYCLQACLSFEMTVLDHASSRQFPTTMCMRRTLQATNGTSFANTVTRYVRGLANMCTCWVVWLRVMSGLSRTDRLLVCRGT